MPLPTAAYISRSHFADLVIEDGHLLAVPPVTRIRLADLATDHYRPTTIGIEVCGEVLYRPFDVNPTTLDLLCELKHDNRPLLTQARTRP